MVLVIRTLRSDDTDVLAEAFADWPKPRKLFESYAGRAATGDLDVLVAVADGRMAGFLIIEPHSSYPPFRARNIPEIADFERAAARAWTWSGDRFDGRGRTANS